MSPLGLGQPVRRRTHSGQEGVAEPAQHPLADAAGVAAPAQGVVHRGQGRGRIAVGQGTEDGPGGVVQLDHPAGGHHPVQGAEGVPHRPGPGRHHMVDDLLGRVQAGVGGHEAHVLGQGLGPQQAELEDLAAAADRLHHLVGLGGGQHPDDVVGRLLQGLQQGVLRPRREHVGLVEQVDLDPARSPELDPLQQGPHVVDLVVGGGVQFVQVEGPVLLDGQAGLAGRARLAVAPRIGAVEGFGQDPGGGGLSGPPGAVEQVGVPDPALAHRRPQRRGDVILALDLGERPGPVAAVQRLVCHRR